MLVYVYDNTFEGLLTAIYEAYYRRQPPDRILRAQNLQENLLDTYIPITTDSEKAQKVYHSIKSKICPLALNNAYYVFLSELEDCGTWVYEYLKLGWKVGRGIDLHLSDDRVLRVVNLQRKVFGEVHRMLGLLRFKCLDGGIFYAPIGTDYNILELLAPHFAERLSDQNWVIHDVKRGLAAIYDRKDWAIARVNTHPNRGESETESIYQDLWKQFFNSISISNRANTKVQRQHMPVRYWKHLTEMQ